MPGVTGHARHLCGVRADGQEVAFVGRSDLLPGGSEEGFDVYTYPAGAASAVRIGPASDAATGLSTWCGYQGMAASTGELAFVYAGQVYVL